MPEYTRRPVKVTAYQFDGSQRMAIRLAQWYIDCKGPATPSYTTKEQFFEAIENRKPAYSYDTALGLLSITTPNGVIEMSTGDWLVHTPDHEFLRQTDEAFTEQHSPILKPVSAP